MLDNQWVEVTSEELKANADVLNPIPIKKEPPDGDSFFGLSCAAASEAG